MNASEIQNLFFIIESFFERMELDAYDEELLDSGVTVKREVEVEVEEERPPVVVVAKRQQKVEKKRKIEETKKTNKSKAKKPKEIETGEYSHLRGDVKREKGSKYFEAMLYPRDMIDLLNSTVDMVPDANFEFSKTGLLIETMDSSHVTLIQVRMLAEHFLSYHCDSNFILGINLASLKKIIDTAHPGDICKLESNEAQETLTVVLGTLGLSFPLF